jgi:hypothetical protein
VRRSRLGRAAAISAVALFPLAACGDDDAQVFSASSVTVSNPATVPTTAGGSPAAPVTTAPVTTAPVRSTAPTATTATSKATTPPTTAPVAAPASGTFPAGGQLVVDFTFAVTQPGRQIRNPYVAVWVEDPAGKLVQTIGLWYMQGQKGQKWLSDLRGWYSASNGRMPVTTGATRVPGAYSVAWNGTGSDGKPVPAGNYVLFVEAAREHGPYEITSAPITIGAAGFTVPLADNGELIKLSATLKV